MQQKTYWNKVANEKKFTIPVSVELLGKHITLDSAILDFGCGYGRILEELKRNGFLNLAGVDIAENSIEIAKANLPNVDFKVNTGMDIPYDDSYFEAVIISAVLTCIPSNDDQKRLISEIKRVLKPAGIVYMCDFLINKDKRNLDRYNKYRQKHGLYGIFEIGEGVVFRHHTLEWIDDLTFSFTKLLFEEKTYSTMNNHMSKGFCFVGKKDRNGKGISADCAPYGL
jgi:SAM-dependent methyltransferase